MGYFGLSKRCHKTNEQENFECQTNENYYQFIRYVQMEQWNNTMVKIINISDIKFFGTFNNNDRIMNEDLGYSDIFDWQ